jgi:hypothetical protein
LRILVLILKIRPQKLLRIPLKICLPSTQSTTHASRLTPHASRFTPHAALHPSGALPRPSHTCDTSLAVHASRHSRPTHEAPTNPIAVPRKSNWEGLCRMCDLQVWSPIDNLDMKLAMHMEIARGHAPCKCDQLLTWRRKSDLRPTSDMQVQVRVRVRVRVQGDASIIWDESWHD